MELYYKAIHNNNFGLRKWYPWTCQHHKAPWMTNRITRKEQSYVYSIMRDIFHRSEMNIERVENPYIWGRYVLRYEEMRATHASWYVNEEVVVHATSNENSYKIADNNFDWRLVNRCRYGQGVSFATDAEYAKGQATENEVYIITGILVANCDIGNYRTNIPSYNSDTTINRQKSVYVKYNDNEYYPYYVAY